MNRDVIALMDEILKPSNLLCKSLDSVILHDRMTLRAHHTVIENSTGKPYQASPSHDYNRLMSKYSKIELFSVDVYGGNNLNTVGDILFSIDEQPLLQAAFNESQNMGKQELPEEWEEYLDYNPDVLNFLKGVFPFAAIGGGGDILAFDTYKLSPESEPRVLYIPFENLLQPFDLEELADEDSCGNVFDSFADFLLVYRDMLRDDQELFSSSWRYIDNHYGQYCVEKVIYD